MAFCERVFERDCDYEALGRLLDLYNHLHSSFVNSTHLPPDGNPLMVDNKCSLMAIPFPLLTHLHAKLSFLCLNPSPSQLSPL